MNPKINELNFTKTTNGGISLIDTKIKGFGKANINLKDNNLSFKALETTFNVQKSVNDIEYLIYSKGNFFFDDTIYMGINGEQFEITCKNDEIGLRNLYDNLINIKSKNSQKQPIPTKENNITPQTTSITQNTEENNVSTSEEIRNCYNLMKEGIITKEEFEQMKKDLINKNNK